MWPNTVLIKYQWSCMCYMLYVLHAVCATCCMCYMLYVLHGVCATCCMCYMLYVLHGVCATCCMCYMLYVLHAVCATWCMCYMLYVLHAVCATCCMYSRYQYKVSVPLKKTRCPTAYQRLKKRNRLPCLRRLYDHNFYAPFSV